MNRKCEYMETTLFIPTETDIKKWVKEALAEHFNQVVLPSAKPDNDNVELLNRKQIAKLLQISLVTLTDWIKRGLPSHKQGSRVYFIKSEIMEFIRQKQSRRIKFAGGFQKLNQEVA